MKIIFLTVTIFMIITDNVFSQDTSDRAGAENAVYLELFGSGLLYSINYDRILKDDVSIRGGFSYIPKIDLGMAGHIGPGFILPAATSKLISSGADNYVELGFAHTLFLIEEDFGNSFGPIIGFREQNLK